MLKNLIFVTSNLKKLQEVNQILASANLTVRKY